MQYGRAGDVRISLISFRAFVFTIAMKMPPPPAGYFVYGAQCWRMRRPMTPPTQALARQKMRHRRHFLVDDWRTPKRRVD